MRPLDSDRVETPKQPGLDLKSGCSQGESTDSFSDHGAAIGKFENSRNPGLNIVILDPSGGHPWARYGDVYRTLSRELGVLGHKVRVLAEANRRPSAGRGLSRTPAGRDTSIGFYSNLSGLRAGFAGIIRSADVVVVGSGLGEGRAIGDWVTRSTQGVSVFYDLATTSTLSGIKEGTCAYLSAELISRFQLYLSVIGGRMLDRLESDYESPMARPFYHSVDTDVFYPDRTTVQRDLGYVGDYDEERQPALDELLIEPARLWGKGRFAVGGQNYPQKRFWPANVKYLPRMGTEKRRQFYNSQKFALTAASSEAAEAGFSPGRRMLEIAACGIPVISDYWEGVETFFEPLEQILIARCAEETLSYLRELGLAERQRIGARARHRVLMAHSSRQRALELQRYLLELIRPSVSIMS
jgi:spore maturation protein CgeB